LEERFGLARWWVLGSGEIPVGATDTDAVTSAGATFLV